MRTLDTSEALAKSLHKSLKIRFIKRSTRINIVFVKCERNKAIIFVNTGFMDTPDRPLFGPINATAHTSAAGKKNLFIGFMTNFLTSKRNETFTIICFHA